MNWDAVRREFPCTQQQTYLNTGTLGPVPVSVYRRYLERLDHWNRSGPGHPRHYGAWHDQVDQARLAVAQWIGAPADTLTFTDNVTDALNIVLRGLRLGAGSRIVTSDQEHGALATPLALLVRDGVRVDVIPYEQGGPPLLNRIADALAEPADLVALSHVSCETGAVVDMAALAALCHERGALLLLDGAQGPGQVAVDVGSTAVDFYAFNGHKWLLAPVGSGALYVRPDALDRLAVTYAGGGAGWRLAYPESWDVAPPPDGRRFEFATRNWPAWVTWSDVLDFWNELPPQAAFRRQRELATALARQIRMVPRATLWSPEVPIGGMVTLGMEGWDPGALFEALADQGVVGRPVRKGRIQGIRLCFSFFNNLDDVERAYDALSRLAATPR